jgi:hypothetical protein
MTQREYDILLVSVPVIIVVGAVIGAISTFPVMFTVGLGSLLASLLVGFAIFGLTPPPIQMTHAEDTPTGQQQNSVRDDCSILFHCELPLGQSSCTACTPNWLR